MFFIFCYVLFHFINNYIKQNKNQYQYLVFELSLFKDMHIRPFFSQIKKVRTEVIDKQVYDMVADNYGIL